MRLRTGVLLSLGVHAALAGVLWLPALTPKLLPRAPITMTILARPHALPALPRGAAAPPGEPAQPETARPAAAPRPKRVRPKLRPQEPAAPPREAAAEVDGLAALWGDTPTVAAMLRADLLRASPHRAAAERLLAAFPDAQLLARASALREPAALARWLLSDTAGLLVLTADPASLTATNLLVLAPERGADAGPALLAASGVTGTGLSFDPRRLELLGAELAVYARPEALAAWQRLRAQEGARLLARLRAPLRSGAALTLVIHRADALLRLGDARGGLPTPTRVQIEVSADEDPLLLLRLHLADVAQAETLLAALPRLRRSLEDLLSMGSVAGLLTGVAVPSPAILSGLRSERKGSEVRISGALPGAEVDTLLAFLAAQMPALPPPPAAPAEVAEPTDAGSDASD